MSRDSKIGLLVGLSFVIVVGILLSEHVTRATEPPIAAGLGDAARTARVATASPGVDASSVAGAVVPTPKTPPTPIAVPTSEELRRRDTERAVASTSRATHTSAARPIRVTTSGTPVYLPPPAVATHEVPITSPASIRTSRLADVSLANGVTDDGARRDVSTVAAGHTPSSVPASPVTPYVAYVARPGDSLSRIATRQLGRDTAANREAIVTLNPSLADNPERVLVGRTYRLPNLAVGDRAPIVGSRSYTVRAGDTLWNIAGEQTGDHATVTEIRRLNADVLGGTDAVRPGMTLRLP